MDPLDELRRKIAESEANDEVLTNEAALGNQPQAPQQQQQPPSQPQQQQQQQDQGFSLPGMGDIGGMLMQQATTMMNPLGTLQKPLGQALDGLNDAVGNPLGTKPSEMLSETAGGGMLRGGLERAVEGIVNTADLIGDTAKTFTNMASEEDNIFSDKYKQLDYDLGIAGDVESPILNFGRELTSILILMKTTGGLGKLAGIGPKTGVAGRLGGEALRGAVADFIVGGEGGNLSNMIQEGPLKNMLSEALAHDEDDNPWERRLKDVVEGGIIGTAVDGLGEFIGAIRAGKKAIKNGKSVDEAVDEAMRATQNLEESRARALWEDPKNGTNKKWDELSPEFKAETVERFKKEGRIDAATPKGAEVREMESKTYGSSPNRPPMFDPQERAARTTQYAPQDAAESYARLDLTDGTDVSGRPLLTDPAFEKVAAVGTELGGTVDEIDRVIKQVGSTIDVEDLAKRLNNNPKDVVTDALKTIEDFVLHNPKGVDNTNWDALKTLRSSGDVKMPFHQTDAGIVSLKTLIADTAVQIDELAQSGLLTANAGADAMRQSDMLFARMRSLLRWHKEASMRWGRTGLAFQIGNRAVDSDAALTKGLEQIDTTLRRMQDLAHKGDPKAIEELNQMMSGMRVMGKDPLKQMHFMDLFTRVGMQGTMQAMYNSMLSGPVTHARNIIGTAVPTLIRPINMATGFALKGDLGAARKSLGAYHSFGDSLFESLSIAKKAWDLDSGSLATGTEKWVSQAGQMAKEIEEMKRVAKTPAQKAAAGALEAYYNFFNSPWLRMPTRAISASDDAFKTLVARMDLKRQAFEEALDGSYAGFKLNEKRYAELLDQKIGPNGQILDDYLIKAAEDVTFQKPLQGFMATVQEATNDNILAKFFLPFIKTPHNLIKFGGSFIPGSGMAASLGADRLPALGTFFKDYADAMAGSDETLKAIMKGREAMGTILVGSAMSMALAGNITGRGPADPKQRAIWERKHPKSSIKIGDTWVSYESIEPLNVILAATSDIVELIGTGDHTSAEQKIGQLAYIVAAVSYDRSMFEGMGRMLEMLNPAEWASGRGGKVASRFISEQLNSLMPASGMRRQLSKALSPYMYEYDNEWQRTLASAIPGAADIIGTRRIDIFDGSDVLNQSGEHIANNVLPFNLSGRENDPVISTLSEIGWGELREYASTYKGQPLEPKHKQQINKLIAEKGLHSRLDHLFNQKWWKDNYAAWRDAKDRDFAGPAEESRWYEAVAEVFENTKAEAMASFAAENPDFAYDSAKMKLERNRRALGGYAPVQGILNFGQ